SARDHQTSAARLSRSVVVADPDAKRNGSRFFLGRVRPRVRQNLRPRPPGKGQRGRRRRRGVEKGAGTRLEPRRLGEADNTTHRPHTTTPRPALIRPALILLAMRLRQTVGNDGVYR